MKKSAMYLLILTAALAYAPPLHAQKLANGERAPEVTAAQWLTAKPSGDKVRLIDFYHSASAEAGALLPTLDRYAEKYAGRLEVVVVAREPKEKVETALMKDSPKYHAAIDSDGKTFAAFGVRVVPFGVVVDAKGKVLWFGNPAQLDTALLEKLLNGQ